MRASLTVSLSKTPSMRGVPTSIGGVLWPARIRLLRGGHLRPVAKQMLPGGQGGGLESAVHAELGEHVLHICANRAYLDFHLMSNLRGALASRHPAQHILLARRKVVCGLG